MKKKKIWNYLLLPSLISFSLLGESLLASNAIKSLLDTDSDPDVRWTLTYLQDHYPDFFDLGEASGGIYQVKDPTGWISGSFFMSALSLETMTFEEAEHYCKKTGIGAIPPRGIMDAYDRALTEVNRNAIASDNLDEHKLADLKTPFWTEHGLDHFVYQFGAGFVGTHGFSRHRVRCYFSGSVPSPNEPTTKIYVSDYEPTPLSPEEAQKAYQRKLAEEKRRLSVAETHRKEELAKRKQQHDEEETRKAREKKEQQDAEKAACQQELAGFDLVKFYFDAILEQVKDDSSVHSKILNQIKETGAREIELANGYDDGLYGVFKDLSSPVSKNCFQYFPLTASFKAASSKAKIDRGPFKGYTIRVQFYKPGFFGGLVDFLDAIESGRRKAKFHLVLKR